MPPLSPGVTARPQRPASVLLPWPRVGPRRFVYILRSDADPARHYVGLTSNVSRRLDWHNTGPSGVTVRHRPWSLVVSLEFVDSTSAARFEPRDYPHLAREVTSVRVRELFAGIVDGDVVRYELPQLGALNFVMTLALGGGVTRSLALDAHGKSLSFALLNLVISDPPAQPLTW